MLFAEEFVGRGLVKLLSNNSFDGAVVFCLTLEGEFAIDLTLCWVTESKLQRGNDCI